MGIPSCRFVDKMHEEFVCTVCFDVAIDPIVVNDCEHIFCRKCIESDELVKCPTCQQPFKEPKWTDLKGGLKRCYIGLDIKCLNPSCDQTLDVTTFAAHDEVCAVTFEFCAHCGYKSRRCESSDHSCSKVLKEFYEAKLERVKYELDQLKEQFEERRNGAKVDQLVDQTVKQAVRDQLFDKFIAERKRTEDLIALCVSLRNSFNGDGGSLNSNLPAHVESIRKRERTGNGSWTIPLEKIVEEYDKK